VYGRWDIAFRVPKAYFKDSRLLVSLVEKHCITRFDNEEECNFNVASKAASCHKSFRRT
jgi:hypothetical protein